MLWIDRAGITIAEPDAHYDASVTSSLTLSGSEVTQWDDLTGNGLHLVRGSASGPSSGTLNRNQLNTAQFNGAQYMKCDSFTNGVSQTRTFLAVFVQDTTPGTPFFSTMATIDGATTVVGIRTISTAPRMSAEGVSVDGSAYTNKKWRQITGTHGGTGSGQVSLRQNVTAVGTGTATGFGVSGDTFHVGGNSIGRFLTGALGEVLVFQPALSTADRDWWEDFLLDKWFGILAGPFTDAFTSVIGPDWRASVAGFAISSSQLRKTTATSGIIDYTTALPANQYAEVDYVSSPNDQIPINGLHLRGEYASDSNGFYGGWSAVGTDGYYIQEAGVGTLATTAAASPPSGKRLRFEANGTSLVLKADGVTVVSTTSSSFPNNNFVGIAASSSGAVAAVFDNFTCGGI